MAAFRFVNFLLVVAALALSAGAAYFFFGDPEGDRLEKKAAAYEKKIETVKAQARTKDAKAQYRLAKLYLNGEGRSKNLRLAHDWFRKAAEQGHVGAQYQLGRMSEAGEGVRQDYRRASEWYHLAAKLGNSRDAHFALGELYFYGRGVSQDPGASIDWYRLAAEQGHPMAQYILGTMYDDGWGVAQNSVEAYKLYKLAARKAEQIMAVDPRRDPNRALENLILKMNSAQEVAGKTAVKKWKPRP